MSGLLDSLSESYDYSPITYFDSFLSVDPIIGCQSNCDYCFMQITGWTGVPAPQQLYTVDQIISLLLKNKYFVQGSTVLCFGNRTDPFLKHNAQYTLDFIESIDRLGINNPLVVVTKKQIPIDFIGKFSKLKHVKLVFCISYSGLSSHIEKGVTEGDAIDNFYNLRNNGIPAIHNWRPILKENSSPEIIKKVLGIVANYAIASVCVGLKLNKELNRIYRKKPDIFNLPENVEEQGEYFPPYALEQIMTIAAEEHPNHPLYRHTSCAISMALSTSDYNGSVYRDDVCKNSHCPSRKRKICEKAKHVPALESVKELIKKIGARCTATVKNGYIEIEGKLTQEDYVFLLHHLNYPIVAKSIDFNLVLKGSIYKQDPD